MNTHQNGLFREVTRLDELMREVAAFHEAHPQVWKLFARYTQDRIRRGFKHYSCNAIFERIRWETDQAQTDDTQFKLNNNYRAFYARRFMRLHPEHEGFFRTRKQKSVDAPATHLPPLEPKDFE